MFIRKKEDTRDENHAQVGAAPGRIFRPEPTSSPPLAYRYAAAGKVR